MELRAFREKYGLTQQEFADIIGVPRTTYQMWEYDWRKASNSNMILLEKAMKKIETENADIVKALDDLEKLKQLENAQKFENICYSFEDDIMPCKKWKYVLLLIILVLIFTVLY